MTVNCQTPLTLVTALVLPAKAVQVVIGSVTSELASAKYSAWGVPTKVSVNVPSTWRTGGFSALHREGDQL